MNLDFHSNPADHPDPEFHSKQTLETIYTPDPRDPFLIHDLETYFSTGKNPGLRRYYPVQNYSNVHICSFTSLIHDSGERAQKKFDPYSCKYSCSHFREHGSGRAPPLIGRLNAHSQPIGPECFLIHAPDQGWIRWIREATIVSTGKDPLSPLKKTGVMA